ncbi:SEL1-like repeat protein [Helicobacter sp. L8]|uniref:tetratricopeptide repeat protein n=1 Tax=Helicobacter sp. L8 TaxID=2316078 RepID=UPI000EB3F310|nr:SEL1-like repeat protein [Helicobacter sp. L8]
MLDLFSLKNVLWVWLVVGLSCLSARNRDARFYDPSCDNAWNLVFPDENKKEDDKKALLAFQKAIKKGKFCGYNGLAYLYENGLGVEQDYHKALKLYEKIGRGGYGGGYADMARMYDQGLGVPADEKKADYYEKLCHESVNFPDKIYNHMPDEKDGCSDIRGGVDPKSLDMGPTEYMY